MSIRWPLVGVILLALSAYVGPALAADDDPLAAWKSGVKVRPVAPDQGRHSIHTYYLATPESPDGRSVLYYTSAAPESHSGDLRVLDRATGAETVIARNITTEDAHRAACQQWVSGGRRVVYHDVRDGVWLVACVDAASCQERILARGRQLGFGQPAGNLVPIYGPHWKPEGHKDLELLNVETDDIRTALTMAAAKARYGAEIAKPFGGDRETSIFFPVLSPDLRYVFFKLATPLGGDFRSKQASDRRMLIAYDLEKSRLLACRATWGHPFWHPDSRRILEIGHQLIDAESGAVARIPDLPKFPGSHPSVSPDGRLFVTDTGLVPFGGTDAQRGIAVGSMKGGQYVLIHRFDNSRGARSWRRSDPHPSFSPDGRRIYFNVSDTEWTRLYVAEAAPPEK
jgi:dipeptidyl aminopeptidase/acylaminoacyl peptidase